jgi:hypothetical protein
MYHVLFVFLYLFLRLHRLCVYWGSINKIG